MIFNMNEHGDLQFDSESETLTTVSQGDLSSTQYKTARTTVITYFILRQFFSEQFVKGARMKYTVEQMDKMIRDQLDFAFKDNNDLRQYVDFISSSKPRNYNIYFYYKKEGKSVPLILYDVEV